MVKSRTSLTIISSILIVLITIAGTYFGLMSLGYVHTRGIEIEIQLKDASKTYDGETLYASEYEIVSGTLVDGDTINVTITGSQTDVGTSSNTISSVSIKNTLHVSGIPYT